MMIKKKLMLIMAIMISLDGMVSSLATAGAEEVLKKYPVVEGRWSGGFIRSARNI